LEHEEDLEEEKVILLKEKIQKLTLDRRKLQDIFYINEKLKSEIVSIEEERDKLKKKEHKILREILSFIIRNKEELLKPEHKIQIKEDEKKFRSNIKKIEEIFNFTIDSEEVDLFIPYFLSFAENEKIEVDLNFLKAVTAAFRKYETRIVPRNVINFVLSYLENSEYQTILDPWAKNGTFLVPIWQQKTNLKALGIIEKQPNLEILNLLYPGLDITWESTNLRNLKSQTFDLIVGFPHWGSSGPSVIINSPDSLNNYINHLKNIKLINALSLLSENGSALLLLPPRVLSWKCKSEFISDLEKIGVYIDSILEIPRMDSIFEIGDFEPVLGRIFCSNGLLIIFTRKKKPDLFVAELSEDMKINQEVILDNLLNRQSGKIPQMGFITSLEEYSSIKSLNAKIDTKKMALNAGLKPSPSKEIIEKINISNNPEKSDIDKVVYLPFDPKLNASVSFEDLEKSEQFHAQLILNTKKAFPEYLKHFFNSEIGYKFRESWKDQDLKNLEIGTSRDINDKSIVNDFLPRFEEIVMNSEMYLPDLKVQMDTVEVNDMISELDQQISDYKFKLWKWPLKNNEIKKSVELLKVGNRFDYWIDSLPYPLSSILLSCSADSNVEHRLRYVLHFYEALTEFNVSIILSALNNDKNLIKEFTGCLQDTKYPNWYYKPTFGNWNYLGNCLAKRLRMMLNESEKSQIYKAFGNPSPKFFEIITSKKLYNILRDAAEYRNKWIGHGPPVSEEENRRRLKILGSLISKTNQTISHKYDGSYLVQPIPGTMSYDEGVFSTKIKVLKGRLPFKDYNIETIHPLDNKKTYLYHENQYEALELLPFFKIMESPKTEHNACYFYNSYEGKEQGKEINLISYHFDKEPIAPGSYEDFKPLFSLFKSNNY
jgi:hypothetical protein